jgi:choline dehydrogenase-like flavoprotein
MYRSVQRGSVPNLRDAAILLRDFGWLSQAVWWRLAKRRLLAPRQARFELVLVVEQMPNADNRISLSRDRDDKYGVPIAQIMWRPREADLVTFNKLQSALLAHWAESNLASLGTLTPTPEDVWQGRLFEGADIFHPGGSIRMGTGPLNGVVDRDLRTFRVGNLYVVSTATFPSGGSANPSFMLMAFALRAADRVVSELRDRPVPSLQT